MPSNASRGAYYKGRSKKFLEAAGYAVFDMEIQRIIYTPDGMLPTKRDQAGADLMFFDLAAGVVVFVQVKGGASKSIATLTKDAMRAFEKFTFPFHSRRELHVWRPLARAPEVVQCL